MRNMLAAFAVAFAPVFAPALAADGTNDTNDTDEQLKADIARLEGKIDTLTKTVASNAASLTTKVDDAADALAAVEQQLGEGAVAIYQSIPGTTGMHFVGGNLAGAGLDRHSHILLPAGLYEVEIQRWSGAGALYVADGDHVQRIADPVSAANTFRIARAVVNQSGGLKVWSFHTALAHAHSYYTSGRRPGSVDSTAKIVRVRRLGATASSRAIDGSR